MKKKLINSILYGASVGNDTWFIENKIPILIQHKYVNSLVTALAQCTVDLTEGCPSDGFCQKKHPTENKYKWKMTALNEILIRIEGQKLACYATFTTNNN